MKDLELLVVWMLLIKFCISSEVCDFDPDTRSKWRSCRCERLTLETAKAYCRHLSWLTIPALPPAAKIRFHTTSLTIVESGLIFLAADAFRGMNIQVLKLYHNQIDTINNHAFRGLESKLYELYLNGNALTRVPAKQLSNLHQLHYLYLRNNRIDEIELTTFQETQLYNLRYLYLDYNLISTIPASTFSPLRLLVLTLDDNRLQYLDGHALPATLTHLSMKNNLLAQIPYDALERLQKTLNTLNMDDNNVTQLRSYVELSFERNFTLTLSNNLLDKLPAAAFSAFGWLLSLDLSYNQIEFVHPDFLQGVKYLEQLDLSNNRLSGLPRQAFTDLRHSLKRLILEENEFQFLPAALQSLTSVSVLNLQSNKLRFLDVELTGGFKSSLKELLLSFNSLAAVPTQLLEEMSQLEHLDLSKNQITSLDRLAFGKFNGVGTNLVRLNLAGNRIVALSDPGAFLYMSALAYMDLSYNRLETILDNAFELLPGLESLFLHNNQLRVFPATALRKLPKLRYLVLDDNQILVVPAESLDGYYSLEELSLANNHLNSVISGTFPPLALKKLRLINLSRNYLKYLASQAFANLSQLESLSLQSNLINVLNPLVFYNLPSLKTLHVDYNVVNQTADRCFCQLPRLEYLSLRHNQLSDLAPDAFWEVPNLEFLDLSDNQFEAFTADTLRNVKSLKSLDLSNNRLSDRIEVRMYSDSLERLILRGNRLWSLNEGQFAQFKRLSYLDLSDNRIADIHPKAFLDSPSLSVLLLNGNAIGVLRKSTFLSPLSLQLLDLSRNQLTRLEVMSFGENNLQQLLLGDNRLEQAPTGALGSLHGSLYTLDLSGNRIAQLESKFCDGFRNLSVLRLRGNRLRRVEEAAFKGLHRLRDVDLSDNPVADWSSNAFRDLGHSIESVQLALAGLFAMPNLGQRAIRQLNLSSNEIRDLRPEDFRQMTKLESLDLSGNRLHTLSRAVFFSLTNLKTLNLSHNPIYLIDADSFTLLHKLRVLEFHHLPYLARFDPTVFRHLRNLKTLRFHNLRRQLDGLNVTRALASLPPLHALGVEPQNRTFQSQLSGMDVRFLRRVEICGDDLRKIDRQAFAHLRGFRLSLAVTGTQLQQFSPWIFLALERVTYLHLDLRHNRLQTLEPFTTTQPPVLNQRGTILADVLLENNSLLCDCRLKWLPAWLRYVERDSPPDKFLAKIDAWNRTFCYSDYHRKTLPVPAVDFRSMGCFRNGAADARRRFASGFPSSSFAFPPFIFVLIYVFSYRTTCFLSQC